MEKDQETWKNTAKGKEKNGGKKKVHCREDQDEDFKLHSVSLRDWSHDGDPGKQYRNLNRLGALSGISIGPKKKEKADFGKFIQPLIESGKSPNLAD